MKTLKNNLKIDRIAIQCSKCKTQLFVSCDNLLKSSKCEEFEEARGTKWWQSQPENDFFFKSCIKKKIRKELGFPENCKIPSGWRFVWIRPFLAHMMGLWQFWMIKGSWFCFYPVILSWPASSQCSHTSLTITQLYHYCKIMIDQTIF